ncbi:hypothetical protein LOZ57_003423 [Ophidiomyces ophidiicola]|uniref:uncharacterized protein n=1 Tax=Ophidiomyces ophidiicola TaxID=1387563 RepID=UPI0020C43D3F|nr:uncharacterized protein LOZ57_003423 [Ophidiomyces ophidiicola]KAI1947185.1 hypothetical protein LOZ57_003423 [Ophidiomyces ophidiicola]KAI2062446.1 hypothetical protein LOZ43_000500 [Ophidiomyces ophidiicola]
MSSLRNAVQRRQHRERAQPEAREKWGLLEKRKDYSLRAADYNLKKAKLQRLREKARDRNPDEFNFGMMSSGSRTQGHHGARNNSQSSLSLETVKLLKTQDAGYLRVAGEKIRRQMEKVENDIRLQNGIKATLDKHKRHEEIDEDDEDTSDVCGVKKQGKRVVYVNSVDEQTQYINRVKEGSRNSTTTQKHPTSTQQPSKKQQDAQEKARREVDTAKRLRKRAALARLKKLEILKKQHQDFISAERGLELQRAKMENSVGGVNKYGIKWKVRERKR